MSNWKIVDKTHTAHLTLRPSLQPGMFVVAVWILPNGVPKGDSPQWAQEFPSELEARNAGEDMATAKLRALSP
ncbi:hypothetical protein [Burkholderia lata]|uniref:hypothetical protein n=1 Tax=Burkholderia lata (strain ATCC 17760 / DSM 23089 / LMG 22485 / NCIMB 9086 / R18194 / 383) TaxID=482957 RepID=UPI000AD14C27|nr:hypothetical protein [Burkholderia lata]